ncbi:MAG: TIGR03619 family F420-dependent LLM class oxidoreductase [Nitrososphaerales archaeon]
MRFGVRLPNSGPLASRKSIVEAAKTAEALGYDSIWVHDHIVWGTEQHRTHLSAGSAEALTEQQLPNFYESLTTLSVLAGMTERIKLGVAVIILPLRNPVVLAKQTSVLDVLSEGRFLMGVAPGAPKITEKEFEAVNVPYHERGKITDDYIKAIKAIWTMPLATYSGKYVSFKELQIFPKPLQKPHPPILIGGGEKGLSEKAFKRASELGEGWIPAYLTEEELTEGVKRLREMTAAAGRTVKMIVGLEMFTSIDSVEEKALNAAKQTLTTNFSSLEEGLRRSFVGTPTQISKRLEGYRAADYFELKFIYPSVERFKEMLKLFAETILKSFN